MADLTPEEPEVPADFPTHILDWFWELSATRSYQDGYPRSILPTEVEAWSRLSGVDIMTEEYRVLCDIDAEYVREYGELVSNARAQYKNNRGK